MNPTAPRKNEAVFVVATIFLAVSAGITSLRFVRGTAFSFTVMSGVACTVAVALYLVGILWGVHEDGKSRR
ncbi:MAG: hypothetical protein ABSF67_13340 [Roseiarcus sp.]|jgi:hypothetical protein